MDTRVNLAWCLLLQALYQSGQETVIAEHKGSEVGSQNQDPDAGLAPGPDARHLLQECLRHSVTVRHLSARPANHLDIEKLQALVVLAGGHELLLSAEEGGAVVRDNIARAVWSASDQDSVDTC